jgi:flagellar motor switch protein FliN/FliY
MQMESRVTLNETPSQSGAEMTEMLIHELVRVKVVLARSRLGLERILKMARSSVLELEGSMMKDQVEVVVNDRVVAWGDVVTINGNYGVRLQRVANIDRRGSAAAPGK